MKFTFLLSALLGSVLFISLIDREDKLYSPLVVMSVDEGPTLPSTPYEYKFSLPEHLNPQPTNPPYYTDAIDTIILPRITNTKATLGRVLFYDEKLSANENMSCSSCHLQSNSFADKHAKSTGQTVDTKRNSMHLNDLAWSNNDFFFWDLRHNDLSKSLSLPLKEENELGANINDVILKLENTDYYPQLFRDAYGTSDISEEKITEAIADFIASINSFNSRFDQEGRDEIEFTADEKKGGDLFNRDCSSCHTQGQNRMLSGLNIKTKSELSYNGYPDSNGDKGATNNITSLQPLFKISTLRNLELTAPYMHDGGIPDLDSLINFYSDGIQEGHSSFIKPGGFKYSKEDKKHLKSFLLTLTDHTMAEEVKWSNPFGLVSGTQDLQANISIRPNPVSEVAEITIDEYSGTRKDISIIDIQGKVVFSDYFTGDNYTISRSNLSQGMYIVRIFVDNKLGSYKLMVQ